MDFYPLLSRKILQISGPDRKNFLQGLVTCDVKSISEKCCLYGAFLTPQGRIKAPFLLFENQDCLFLDLPSDTGEAIQKYLLRMKLRNQVTLSFSPLKSFACLSKEDIPESFQQAVRDPRLETLGWRGLYEPEETETVSEKTERLYQQHLAKFAIMADECLLERKKENYPSELNLDLLGAISWTKGCYIGQEVTARFYHRSLTKRRLMALTTPSPIKIEAAEESYLYDMHGKKAGKIIYTNASDNVLALVEKKYWNESSLFFKKINLTLQKPLFFSNLEDFS